MNKERKMTPEFYFKGHFIDLGAICTHFVLQQKPCIFT